ncbi:polysaccharide pyruvyl transferase family protein [Mucilaginibacter pedocola]|uniref:Polysaccharide pyruvyl transferase domain-containing protein n=1 Tax=Mucilaginibacter pedocola TaxID=1792845 RepID=A0A1S9P911_9SPHI|nr:polysaccharide pyruvyl transferase family protein [Mucilaginibacter pedocola]OOQ57098.1 hypothetical protein BC343_16350 [Mucilaginibacter pedocola]
MKIKIGIVWADPYNKNLGVGALALSSLALINDVVKSKGLDAEYSFICFTKYKKDKLVLRDKEIEFTTFPVLDYMKPKSIAQLILLPSRYKTGKLLGLDYVFDISAGDSFSDIYGPKRFYLMLNTKRFFAKLGKKQVLLPQTIGPFKDPVYEKQAFDVMKTTEMVISRDEQSYKYSAKFLPKEKIAETMDVAFYMPFEKTSFNNGKINVGINVSGLLWNGGYTRNNQFEMKTDYRKLITDTLTFFSAMDNVQIHIVSHVIPENNPVEDDYTAAEDIKANHFPNVVIAPRFSSPIEAKGYISGMQFFTGARMHACIGAFSSLVPVFLMAYSRKFNGLFKDTLQYPWMGDCVNESEDVVFAKLKDAFSNIDKMAADIKHSMDTIAKPRLDELKQILGNVIK